MSQGKNENKWCELNMAACSPILPIHTLLIFLLSTPTNRKCRERERERASMPVHGMKATNQVTTGGSVGRHTEGK